MKVQNRSHVYGKPPVDNLFLAVNTIFVGKKKRYINEKTPVISRSLFINQKTNSHDKLL
jgi:hypothetical protein